MPRVASLITAACVVVLALAAAGGAAPSGWLQGFELANPEPPAPATLPPTANRFAVTDFGGVGDGATINTAAFARAVAAAGAAPGGGYVVVPSTPGGSRFVSGLINLTSNVFLEVEAGASVLASTRITDYPVRTWTLLYADGAENVGVLGPGTVDGQAVPAWVDYYDPVQNKLMPKTWAGQQGCQGECRVRLLEFTDCRRVLVANVSLTNSPDWTQHYLNCEDVTLDTVRITGNPRWPNNDAFDPDSSRRVRIANSYLDTGDDGICPKTTQGKGVLSDLHAVNCTVRSRSAAIKFGSATPENMTNCLFEDIFIWDTNRGLGLQQRDGGNIDRVTFANIRINGSRFWPLTWWGSAEPLWVTSIARAAGAPPAGRTTNIVFANISALSENGALVSGRPDAGGQRPAQVLLHNVSITIAKLSNYSRPCRDYRPAAAPDLLPSKINGLYFENVDGAVVDSGCSVTFAARRPEDGVCFVATNSTDVVKAPDFRCEGLLLD